MTELSASLMKDLNLILTCRTATSFLFIPSDKTGTGYLFKMLEGTGREDNAVGRMLYGSERFLNIIKRLNQMPCTSSLSSSSTAASYIPREAENSAYDFSDFDGPGTTPIPSSRNGIAASLRVL
ncbi:hypothetical protein V1505DRAFT_379340 [Lipomyces doorenjongii]